MALDLGCQLSLYFATFRVGAWSMMKLGVTSKRPDERVKQLSFPSGNPMGSHLIRQAIGFASWPHSHDAPSRLSIYRPYVVEDILKRKAVSDIPGLEHWPCWGVVGLLGGRGIPSGEWWFAAGDNPGDIFVPLARKLVMRADGIRCEEITALASAIDRVGT